MYDILIQKGVSNINGKIIQDKEIIKLIGSIQYVHLQRLFPQWFEKYLHFDSDDSNIPSETSISVPDNPEYVKKYLLIYIIDKDDPMIPDFIHLMVLKTRHDKNYSFYPNIIYTKS